MLTRSVGIDGLLKEIQVVWRHSFAPRSDHDYCGRYRLSFRVPASGDSILARALRAHYPGRVGCTGVLSSLPSRVWFANTGHYRDNAPQRCHVYGHFAVRGGGFDSSIAQAIVVRRAWMATTSSCWNVPT